MSGSSRNWVFTMYEAPGVHWPIQGEDPVKLYIPEKMKHIQYQMERCPETGRLHMQGFVQLKAKVRMPSAKSMLKNNPHMEIMKGGTKDNEVYCQKGYTRVNGPWKYGQLIEVQGQRTDLQATAEMVVAKKSVKEIAQAHPVTFMKYHRGIQALMSALEEEPKRRDVSVHYYWGPTRCGKTWCIWEKYNWDTNLLYKVQKDGRWWQKYKGQKAILFDDFIGQVDIQQMLGWLEGYPDQVEIKGDSAWARWTDIWMTSNIPIQDLWKKKHTAIPGSACVDWYEDTIDPKLREAFMARVTEVKEFTKRWDSEDTEEDEELIGMIDKDT